MFHIGDNGAMYLEEGISKCATLSPLILNLENKRICENGAKDLG